MRPKTVNIYESTNDSMKTPGPGAYSPKLQLDEKGNYFNSKFKGSGASIFSPPTSPKFYESSKFLKIR